MERGGKAHMHVMSIIYLINLFTISHLMCADDTYFIECDVY